MRTILITGASRGIGAELTRCYLENGEKVIAVARKPEESKILQQLAVKFPTQLQTFPCELTDINQLNTLGRKLTDVTIDMLINNAGIFLKEEKPKLCDLDIDLVAETFRVNVLAVMQVTKLLLPNLAKSKSPVVANMSSLMGSIADNSSGAAYAYRISKTALNMFTKNLALEFKELTAVALHPGWVKTDMGGEKAPIEPQDSAKGLVATLDGLKKADSGSFVDFRGKRLEW